MDHPDLISRRNFFVNAVWAAGAGVAAQLIPFASLSGAAALIGCGDSTAPSDSVVLDFSSEPGVLNFVYALLQLETDYYNRVTGNIFPGMLASERTSFLSFQSATLTARNDLQTTQTIGRIPDTLLFTMDTIDFSNRGSVLSNAQVIVENAANGYALSTGKVTGASAAQVAAIASAATQRATTIRAMLALPAFTVTSSSPAAIMTALDPYYKDHITVTNG